MESKVDFPQPEGRRWKRIPRGQCPVNAGQRVRFHLVGEKHLGDGVEMDE